MIPVRTTDRALRAAFALAVLFAWQTLHAPAARACKSTVTQVPPVVSCVSTANLFKAIPTTITAPATCNVAPFGVNIPVSLRCPIGPAPGAICPSPPTVNDADLTMRFFNCPLGAPLSACGLIPVAAASIDVTAQCASTAGGGTASLSAPVTIPAGVCNSPGSKFLVVGELDVMLSTGQSFQQGGDQVMCVVDEAPGQPGVPRLEIELLSPSIPGVAPGDQFEAVYQITNNDPVESVSANLLARSVQVSDAPDGDGVNEGIYAVSEAVDDFAIGFNPTDCLELPDPIVDQPDITMPIFLAPGETTNVTVGSRSFGKCGNGSCSEGTLVLEGSFSDTSAAIACAGYAHVVDTSIQPTGCGIGTTDCNGNGIADADDIFAGTVTDFNQNAIPDICEITVPAMTPAGLVVLVASLLGVFAWGVRRSAAR